MLDLWVGTNTYDILQMKRVSDYKVLRCKYSRVSNHVRLSLDRDVAVGVKVR